MPSQLRSPTAQPPVATRIAPRWTVAWGGGDVGAASVGSPVAPTGTSTTVSRTSSAAKRGPQGLSADMQASNPGEQPHPLLNINGRPPANVTVNDHCLP